MSLIRQRSTETAPAPRPSSNIPPPDLPDPHGLDDFLCLESAGRPQPWTIRTATVRFKPSCDDRRRIWLLSGDDCRSATRQGRNSAFANLNSMLRWCREAPPATHRQAAADDDKALEMPDLIVAHLRGKSPATDIEQLAELRRNHLWCRSVPIVAIADYLGCTGIVQKDGVFFVSSDRGARAIRKLIQQCLDRAEKTQPCPSAQEH